MTPAEAIAALPDNVTVSVTIGGGGMTVGQLRTALNRSGPVYITTAEAARRYSRTPRWWAREAHKIPGAMKDTHWRLPVQGCEQHLADLLRPKRVRQRGPWTPTTSHPVASRPSGLSAR